VICHGGIRERVPIRFLPTIMEKYWGWGEVYLENLEIWKFTEGRDKQWGSDNRVTEGSKLGGNLWENSHLKGL